MKQLLLFILFFTGLTASAYDFAVGGIYYNVLSSDNKTCVVTQNPNGKYRGNIVIPSEVVYNRTTWSVTSIGNAAFEQCFSLTGITIPNSVTSIGSDAFDNCSGLTSLTIPNSVTSIGKYTFYGCSGLTSLTIPNSVTSIGYGAFSGCSGLTSLTIPNSVTSIGEYTFHGCSGLTSITIPNSVTSIGNCAFYGCSGLTNITIPNSVTSIVYKAFSNCSGLTSLTIPNSVTSIGYGAFSGCSGLMSLTIPSSVTSIGSQMFGGCSSLRRVIIEDSNTDLKIDNGDGGAIFADGPIKELYLGRNLTGTFNWQNPPFPKSLSKVTIGPEVTELASYLFCKTSISTITLPNVKIINEVFNSCSELTTVNFVNNLETIGDYAFYNCENLTKITLPNTVKTIGMSTFSRCNKIKYVRLYADFPPKWWIPHVAAGTLFVPEQSIDYYKASPIWNNWYSIRGINVLKGDSNDNGAVTITDAVNTVNYVLVNETQNFHFQASDVNSDNRITLSDASGTVDIIMNDAANFSKAILGTVQAVAADRLYLDTGKIKSGKTNDENRFFISDFSISAGETKTVSMELSNETVFTAFQTDIYLPAGLSIVDNSFKFTGRSSDHMLTSKKSADGFTCLAGISMSSTEISGSSGALVTFDVVADKAIAETSVIELKNQLFSTPDAREYVLPDASTTVTKVEGPTAVTAVGLAGVNISVGDNELVIENAPKDKVVCLYDADGKLVQKTVSQEGVTRMPVNSARMYILSIDGVSVKITAK